MNKPESKALDRKQVEHCLQTCEEKLEELKNSRLVSAVEIMSWKSKRRLLQQMLDNIYFTEGVNDGMRRINGR